MHNTEKFAAKVVGGSLASTRMGRTYETLFMPIAWYIDYFPHMASSYEILWEQNKVFR